MTAEFFFAVLGVIFLLFAGSMLTMLAYFFFKTEIRPLLRGYSWKGYDKGWVKEDRF